MERINNQNGIGFLLHNLAGIIFRRIPDIKTYRSYIALQSLNKGWTEAIISTQGITNTYDDNLSSEYVFGNSLRYFLVVSVVSLLQRAQRIFTLSDRPLSFIADTIFSSIIPRLLRRDR